MFLEIYAFTKKGQTRSNENKLNGLDGGDNIKVASSQKRRSCFQLEKLINCSKTLNYTLSDRVPLMETTIVFHS
jgi:hypothetical protein